MRASRGQCDAPVQHPAKPVHQPSVGGAPFTKRARHECPHDYQPMEEERNDSRGGLAYLHQAGAWCDGGFLPSDECLRVVTV